jgi:predicted PurR-regulated permease PerM
VNEPTVRTRIEVPTRTIVKIAVAIVMLAVLERIWGILLQVFIALLVTAALDPVVTRLEMRGWKRSVAVVTIFGLLVGLIAALLFLFLPPIVQEGIQLATDAPTYLEQSRKYFDGRPALYNRLDTFLNERAVDPSLYISPALEIGSSVLSFFTKLLLILTMSAYLLIDDGERTMVYIYKFLPEEQRLRVRNALPEISRVVSGYVIGQALTSALFGIFAFAVCYWLGVPQPVLLAILAAFADAIPIVGVFIATIPAALLALVAVSPTAGITVVVLYTIYQQIENYVIIPRVYKGTMALSSFGVLVAVALGVQLLGIVGALIALPVAAAIPVIERAWREDPVIRSRQEAAFVAEVAEEREATATPDDDVVTVAGGPLPSTAAPAMGARTVKARRKPRRRPPLSTRSRPDPA